MTQSIPFLETQVVQAYAAFEEAAYASFVPVR
jgi:hypothetical protein